MQWLLGWIMEKAVHGLLFESTLCEHFVWLPKIALKERKGAIKHTHTRNNFFLFFPRWD